MLDYAVFKRLELSRCDVEIIVHQGEEFRFQDVDLSTADTADTGIVGIVIIAIVKKFDCLHDACDEETMNVVRRNEEGWVLVHDTIKIHQRQNVALVAAMGILHDSLQIPLNRHGGHLFLVEGSDELALWIVHQTTPFPRELIQQTVHGVDKLVGFEAKYDTTRFSVP